MKNIIFIFIGLFLIFSCDTSLKNNKKLNYIPYYLKVYEADSLFLNENYTKCYKILDSLFIEYKDPINMPTYNEYLSYVISAKKTNIELNYCLEINKLISKYGFTKEYLESYTVFDSVFLECNQVNSDYNKLRNKYISNIDLSLRTELLKMKEDDQKYRGLIGGYSDNQSKQESIDDNNTQRLIEIIESIGFPNERLIGTYNIDNRAANIKGILLHTNDSIRENYFIPKLKKLSISGTCLPRNVAIIVDQLHLYNGESQVYGSYSLSRLKIENYSAYNVERKKIGMPSIEFEIWKRNELRKKYKF